MQTDELCGQNQCTQEWNKNKTHTQAHMHTPIHTRFIFNAGGNRTKLKE